MPEILLEVKGIKKYFPIKRMLPFESRRYVKAVDGVDMTIHSGETLGLVGESGCGKSTLGRVILNLLPATEGQVSFKGQAIEKFGQNQMRPWRREMQIIFQDPYAALNPRMSVYQSVKAALDAYRCGTEAEKRGKVESLRDYVGIGRQHMEKYPHELSGGQRQRVVIARALILNPSFIVCDEQVSALDVSVRSQVLNLMKKMQQDARLAYLFISHDLSVVRYLCDRVSVMYLGRIVESADKKGLFEHPGHPYTQALLSAIPMPDIHARIKRIVLNGDVPSPTDPPPGCPFHTRCPKAVDICAREIPQALEAEPGHLVWCHRAGETK
jgi:peptide/nickel transport system ATP-binding protein/oligopeptide transport system ATP-binding protein